MGRAQALDEGGAAPHGGGPGQRAQSQAAAALAGHLSMRAACSSNSNRSKALDADASSLCTIPYMTQLPTSEEIVAHLSGRRLSQLVFFLDETFEEVSYDITTTVRGAG